MISTVYSSTIWGVDAFPVQIEVDLSTGLPQMSIVGLPDQAVREAKERVKAAIKNSGFPFPSRRIIVNLAPADMRKEGPALDLPIAIGILACLAYVQREKLKHSTFLGELALDGTLRRTKGILPVALSLKGSGNQLIIPVENASEAAMVHEVPCYGARCLREVVQHLSEERILPRVHFPQADGTSASQPIYPFDFQEVKGQGLAKRALEVAVSGGHNLLMVGPPGAGKSMLARRIPSILPKLALGEGLEIAKIYSSVGLVGNGSPILQKRPFRTPHHTISSAGLIGGGSFPKPGEISLAHHGVLFLDELPEFRRDVLESLRAPLESGEVWIGRAKASVSFPACFMLVAAMNPCRCGFLGDPKRNCTCSTTQILSYRAKLSGPLLDRMDLHIEVPAVKFSELTRSSPQEGSEAIRKRVEEARLIQQERLLGDKILTNSQMCEKEIKRHCEPTAAGKKLLEMAMNELLLSARAYIRVLKVSRTIADMSGSETIQEAHLAEAIQYRAFNRQLL